MIVYISLVFFLLLYIQTQLCHIASNNNKYTHALAVGCVVLYTSKIYWMLFSPLHGLGLACRLLQLQNTLYVATYVCVHDERWTMNERIVLCIIFRVSCRSAAGRHRMHSKISGDEFVAECWAHDIYIGVWQHVACSIWAINFAINIRTDVFFLLLCIVCMLCMFHVSFIGHSMNERTHVIVTRCVWINELIFIFF